jgi:hypothetical protein
MKFIYVIGLVLLSGCNSTINNTTTEVQNANTLLNHSLFVQQPTYSVEAIFALPPAEQDRFLHYHLNALSNGVREDRIIASYLEDKLKHFTYDGATLSAAQTLTEDKGNCISLAILTQAYANVIGIETSFREVASIPVYRMTGQTLLISTHLNTKLIAPFQDEEGWITAIRPGTVIDYFPEQDTHLVGTTTVDDLISKFYANLATKALLASEFDIAYSYIHQALRYVKNDPELINIAAILHRRIGDLDTAKLLFGFALEHGFLSTNLIANYASLAQATNDQELIERLDIINEKIAKTPFDIITIAQKAVKNKQYVKAEALLMPLTQAYSYLPEPYIELAKLYYYKNNVSKSKYYLLEALNKAEDRDKLNIYQAKLSTLEQMTHKK